MTSNDELKKWLESRFQKIEQHIDELEKSISEEKQPKLRIAWYRTLLGMTDLGGQVGTEQLAGHLGIGRSVISEYLNRMEEEGLVKRDFNEDSTRKSRYVWEIDWNSLPPEIASRLRKK
jgi:predicted transcriptional regulator